MLLRDFGTAESLEVGELLATWADEALADPEDGYALETPPAEYVADLDFSPNLELEKMSGGLVVMRVRGTLDQHAAVVPEVDQSFADSSYVKWERAIDNGSEEAWVEGADLLADDAIEKNAGFGVILPYPMLRDYRWVDLERGTAIVTRSVIYEEGWADDTNGIYGGFTVEMWLPDGDGMIWLNATWTQVVSVVDEFADESFYTDQIINGSTEAMLGTEEYVAGPAR